MDIVSFLRKPRYRNRVVHDFEIRHRRVRMLSKPLLIQVESTNRCNLNCVMCARPYYDKEKNVLGDMSMETFQKIVPFIKTAELVSLFGYGEPLIAKNFWKFLEICAGLGVATAINTNGVKLDEDTSSRLIDGGLGSLTVSLDAAREATFNAIRGYSLKKIVNNLVRFKAAKEKRHRTTPVVNINFVMMKDNLPELVEMVDLAVMIGAASLTVSNMMVYSKSLEERSVFHYMEETKLIFKEAEKKAREVDLPLMLPDFQKKVVDCVQPFEMLFINWDGKVRPCCSAAFVSDRFSLPVGDLAKEDLGTIWNNRDMARIRKGLIGKGKLAVQCATCGFRIKDAQGHMRYIG